MDFISSAKNAGASAFGSSSSSSGSSSGSGGFSNLSIQKMVLLLAIIAFVISVGTVAILLWKSKSTQKWPPEIARCPDRMDLSGNECIDNYGLLKDSSATPEKITGLNETDHCDNFMKIKDKVYEATGLNGSDGGYVPWEGIVDGQKSRAASLKCLV
jgi:preprotein translocase subunit SecG